LPKQKDTQEEKESHGKQAEDMTMEEYLKSKSAQSGADIKSDINDENSEQGELAKDSDLREDVVSDSEVGANEIDNADDDEEAAIAAMREEIKNKIREKNNAEKENTLDNEESIAKQEKKSFFSRFSFRKKEEEIAIKNNENDIEAKKPDEVSGLGEGERRAIEKKANRDNLIVAFLVFVIMSTVGATAFYFYVQYRSPGMVPNVSLSSAEQAKKDADETKRLVSEVIELPDDEEPILATVTDVNKVKNQKFFAKAQNGDRVLIYTINKKAILFRPSTNKIIEVSQVSGLNYNSSDSPENQTEGSQAAASEQKNSAAVDGEKEDEDETVKIAVYNGSTIRGLAQKISDRIVLIPGTAIIEKTNAKNEYEKTIIIDLSGEQEDMAKRIAESMDAEIVSLPDGEKKPDAQILVIGGSNFKATE
jgi:hypothetical protein